MKINLFSFGFKYGTPSEVNVLFDVRFLQNPYWVPELRPLSGLEQVVASHVFENSDAKSFLKQLKILLPMLIEQNSKAGKEDFTIAIGCTGGRHRSVATVEKLGMFLQRDYPEIKVFHQDIEKDGG